MKNLFAAFFVFVSLFCEIAFSEERSAGNSNKSGNPSNSGCLVDQAALEDLKKSRDMVDLKMKELDSKEAELKEREEVIAEQLKKIEEVRTSIVGIQAAQKKEHQVKVAKLIETLLTMSPKAAAKMMGNFEDSLAVEILSTMDTLPLAKIMNLMDPKKSSALSQLMTGSEKKKTEVTQVAKPTSSMQEGGDPHGNQPKPESHAS